MDATAWTVSGTGVAILAAIGAAFWSMRAATRALQARGRPARRPARSHHREAGGLTKRPARRRTGVRTRGRRHRRLVQPSSSRVRKAPPDTGVARHRVPPVRHLDAGGAELAVRQRAEAGARGAQIQLVQRDAADGGLHAEALGQLPGHVEPGGVPGPDAVVEPVRRRRPDQRQRSHGDVLDVARRDDPVDEGPDRAPLEQRAGDAVEAAAGSASVRPRPVHAAAEQALDAQHAVPRPLREPLPQQLRRRIDALCGLGASSSPYGSDAVPSKTKSVP